MKPAVRGASVCGTHGAGAPQVARSARERINDLVDPSINVFAKAVRSRDPELAMKAARDVLKAAGLNAPPRDDSTPTETVVALLRTMTDVLFTLVEDQAIRRAWADEVRRRIRPSMARQLEGEVDGEVVASEPSFEPEPVEEWM